MVEFEQSTYSITILVQNSCLTAKFNTRVVPFFPITLFDYQALQVETFGAMAKIEKIAFILEQLQVRLCLDR
ncbi:hypothetical protein CMV_019609 [Castanea mollissima]|uniref:PSMD12/CSN4-like N-terminal domain-containing protein n=1 Tax=Castanea mollissima TaxID=60419 RepID=A0A8J4QPK2_9ROSI|nr:hypothetical protein CMV_019609 [Castanea mollissima]